MMSTYRCIGRASGGMKNMTINGRVYTVSAGGTVDAPEQDASHLGANGFVRICMSGTTAQRPTAKAISHGGTDQLYEGMLYLDTTLGYIIVYDGGAWRNPASGASV